MKSYTLIVESAPTERGGSRNIAPKIDEAIAKFVEDNPKADVQNVSLAGDFGATSFNRAIVTLLFAGSLGKPEVKPEVKDDKPTKGK